MDINIKVYRDDSVTTIDVDVDKSGSFCVCTFPTGCSDIPLFLRLLADELEKDEV